MIKFEHISCYNNEIVQLPTRATKGSSGYDFYAPERYEIHAGEQVLIPTGIRFITDEQVWLMCMPRSGLGFKYGMRLLNTVGNIDSDYWHSDNEGHIMAKITADKDFVIEKGDRFMQGVILPYLVTNNDSANGERNGGFGSTGIGCGSSSTY